MKENFIENLKSYVISFAISMMAGVTFFLIYFFCNNSTMYAAINGTSIAAIVLLSLGGLMWVSFEGFFDIFSYGFKQLFSSAFAKDANKDNDFAGYKEQNRTKRESKPKIFLSILVSGTIFLIAMIVVRIVEAAI